MMTKFLLIAFLGFSPLLALAQSSAPSGIDADRYEMCMNDGFGKGRSYTTPETYCQQWAGPSAAAARAVAAYRAAERGYICNVTYTIEIWNGVAGQSVSQQRVVELEADNMAGAIQSAGGQARDAYHMYYPGYPFKIDNVSCRR